MKKYLLGFIFGGLTFLSFSTLAQITGATSVSVGQTVQYRTGGTRIILEGCPYWSLSGNGTIEYEDARTARINWTAAGTATIWFSDDCAGIFSSLSVTIEPACVVATPNTTFSYSTNTCGTATVTYTSAPPSGETWYWQTNALGTSMANSTNTYTAGVSGTYYVRAYSGGCWSPSSASANVTVSNAAQTPYASISVSSNSCGTKTITITAGAIPPNEAWYWQDTNPSGTSFSSIPANMTTTRYASTLGTNNYYLRSLYWPSGCWSANSQSVSITVNAQPAEPAIPSATNNACGPQTLSFTGTPPGGVTWYWQDTYASGTSTANSSSTYTVNTSGNNNYYLRAYNGVCWSNPVLVNTTVANAPQTPFATISVSNNSCGTKTITITAGAIPLNEAWYWQDTNPSGTNFSSIPANMTTTRYASALGTNNYYIRSLYGPSGCWSANSQSVSITVNALPPDPAVPTTTSIACGNQTLSFSGTPPGGVTWYWQGTNASGTSTANSSTTYTANTSGNNNYYLRAYNGLCWSNPVSVNTTVATAPQTPFATISVSNNSCGTKTITITAGAIPPNEGWYWQDTNPSGTNISNIPANMTTTRYASALGTNNYYIRSLYGPSGCWSTNSQSVTITVNDPPPPSAPTSNSMLCGARTLSMTGTPPPNTTWYWQGNNSNGQDNSATAAQATYTASVSGTYYLRAQNTLGCWSQSSASVVVTLTNIGPPAPPAFVASINTCGPKTLTMPAPPPGGVTYYWQGTDANGIDTSPVAAASTFAAPASGTYYLRAKDNNGNCWSPAQSIGLSIDPVDIIINSYDPLNPVVQATRSITLGPNFTVPSGSSFSAKIVITSECNDFVNWTEQIAYDQNTQPISDSRTYQDGFGNTILTESIDFLTGKVWASQPLYDNLNNPSASTMPAPILESGFIYKNNFVQNSSNQIYSANDFDKPVVSGLAGELNNPKPVGNAAGTLGWYYSTANNLEPATPTTQFPYSRSYTPPGPNPTTSKSAGVGENNKMGSNHEVSSQKTVFAASEINHYYQLRTLYIIPGSPVPTGNLGYKVVSTDPNQKQSTSYTDADGRSLASFSDNKWSYTYYNDVGQVIATIAPNGVINGVPLAPKFVTYYKYDHLGRLIETTSPDEGMSQFVYSTDGKIRFSQNQLQRDAPLQTPPTPARFSYTNYDYLGRLIESGEYEVSGTTPYAFEPHTTAVPASTSVLNIVDNVGYTGVTGNGGDTRCKETNFIQYDAPASDYPTDALHTSQNYLIGQVARTKNENTTTWYSYDEFGQLAWMKQSLPLTQSLQWSALTGVSQNLNTITKNGGTTNWDAGAFSVQSIASDTNGWIEFSAGETNTYKMMGLSATNPNASYASIAYALYFLNDGTVQIYENGAFKGTFGTYNTTDVFRVERVGTTVYYKKNGAAFYPSTITSTGVLYGDCSLYTPNSSIKNISLSVNSPTKTVDYEYDYFGNVLKVAYQQGQTDAFYHHYDYDKNNRLTVASTSLDGTTKAVRAKYFYYLHGPLKRVELGNNIQGIDYVYNIDGSLKFINHPDPTKDIGKDGISGTNAGFQPDVFGMALDYNTNDYVPAGYADAGSFSLPGTYPDQFGGAVKSIRWHSPSDSHVPRGYAFNYDNRYQLTNADFGSVTGAGIYGLNINTVSGTPNFQQYKEAVTNYDNNGNIKSLIRNGKTGNSLANYNYTYTTSTNKLASVTNGGSALLNYQYNSIGQLTQQTEGTNTMKISYTAYGLTKEIRDGANKLKASYAYDDRGNRVKKTIYNSSEAVQNITYYVSDAAGNTLATYEQDVAGAGSMYLTEVPIYAAGRVGIYKPLTNYSIYEVNDHLGNVRGVVGNPEPFTYTATMEDNGQPVFSNPRVQEMAYFKNLFATANTAPYMNRTAPSTAVPAPNTSSYTYWKSGFPGITPDLKSIGPAIGITVQPGDKLDMEAYVKFETKPSYSRSSIAGSMATLLANSFVNTAVGLETVAQASQVFNNGLASALSATGIGNGNETNNRPHAYLYYLLYDRNFNFVTAGWKRVSATSPPGFVPGAEITSVHERVSIPQITITDPGYVYIYVANESEDTRVWWDDLKITHLRSNIVAGADYYPFGLPMENREITREDYRYGYQGLYAEKDKETGWNAFELRMYDARVARWMSVDPEGQYFSPYLGMGNNPENGVDEDGGWFGKLRAMISAIFTGGEVWQDLSGNWRVSKSINFSTKEGFGVRSVDIGNYGQSGFRGGVQTAVPQFGFSIQARQNNFFGNLKKDYGSNFLGGALYSSVDNAYVTFQLGDNRTNLEGYGVSRDEITEAGMSTLTSRLPITKLGGSLVKGINAAQFSKAFKGTFVAKLQPKIRGFLNIQLNKQVLKKPASLIMSGGSGAAKLVNGKND